MKIVATIEARMTSSRLPGKMTLPLGGTSILGVLIDRLKRVPELDAIVLATTTNSTDEVLGEIAEARGISVFRGSETDVLGRVRGALDSAAADVCVEITGDCPLTDPKMVSAMVREFMKTRGENGYVANTTGPVLGAPHGLDVQVFDADSLRTIADEETDLESREHVSLPFYRLQDEARWRPRFISFFPEETCRKVWVSLDYKEDYGLIRDLHEHLSRFDPYYGAEAIAAGCLDRPQMTRACLSLRGLPS